MVKVGDTVRLIEFGSYKLYGDEGALGVITHLAEYISDDYSSDSRRFAGRYADIRFTDVSETSRSFGFMVGDGSSYWLQNLEVI